MSKKKRKYHVIRKNRSDEEYDQDIKLIVDGEEKPISKASKFLLDMITDE